MAEKIDYEAALRECGFDQAGVARGLRMLQAKDIYEDFGQVVTMLQIEGHTAYGRRHILESVRRQVAAQEAVAAIEERGRRAALHIAAAHAEREAREAERRRLSDASSAAMSWLTQHMTEAEMDEREPLRPEISEAWRQYLDLRAAEQLYDGGEVSAVVQEMQAALAATGGRFLSTRAAVAYSGKHGITRSTPSPTPATEASDIADLDESIQAGLKSVFNVDGA